MVDVFYLCLTVHCIEAYTFHRILESKSAEISIFGQFG